MSQARKITLRVLNVLVWVSLVAAVAVIIVPRLLGMQLETVMSGSMVPALPVGSIVAVQPTDTTALEVGDIITFVSFGNPPLTTHRIVEVNDDGTFVTQGDANEDPDLAPVDDGAVVGRVAFFIPVAGYAAVALKQPTVWAMLFFAGLLLWSASELVKGRRRDKAPVEEQTSAAVAEQVAS